MAGQPLTNVEWQTLLGFFPALNEHRAECLKTGEATFPPALTYSCIAWSVNFTGLWINAPAQRDTFVELCECGSRGVGPH
jgi:hypothetical protein